MTVVLVFAGEYDLSCREQLRAELGSVAAKPAVVLDFADVTFIDSTVLTELYRFQQSRQAAELLPVAIVIRSGSAVERLLDIVDARRIFPIFESVCDALPPEAKPDIRQAFRLGEEEQTELPDVS